MLLKFVGDIKELEPGINVLAGELGFKVCDEGVPVFVEKTEGLLQAALYNGKGSLRYSEKVHFFRALGLFVEEMGRSQSFDIIETPRFSLNGGMFDVSRNAVLKTESIKYFLRKMAIMGLNMMMLYTEDIYTIEGEPYFGYMRGRYTHQELAECDDYASIFGIEMIPCIQTLAHLEQFLRWHTSKGLKDTRDVLLAGNERTYEFIEKMIKAITAPFRSKRIHIGMDEAHGLGLGKYLGENGYQDRFGIMIDHLKRVMKISEELGLKPMMWSDMFFRLASSETSTDANYDMNADIPQKVIDNIPGGVQMVFWEYYNEDEEFYKAFIKKHKSFGSMPVFAGGIWTWQGPCTNYGRTFVNTNAALTACKNEGVSEVFATMWMDDGAENNFFTALLGLQLYAEHGFSKELDLEKLKKRVKFCTGVEFEDFMDLKYLDETPGSLPNNKDSANPSKYLLWQDILLGLFDKHAEGLDLALHYETLENKMKAHDEKYNDFRDVFKIGEKLCSVLKIKCDMGIRMKKSYLNGNRDELSVLVSEQLPDLYEKVKELKAAHRKQWFDTYKPFGWEVLDMRYGGLLSRIDTAMLRMKEYIHGETDRIEELEETRLYFDGCLNSEKSVYSRFNNPYFRIATPNAFTFAIEL
jgi:hexosaminidase